MATTARTALTATQRAELANIRASWAVEGQHVTATEMDVLERVATGELDPHTAYTLMHEQDAPAHS
ncbi:hypothetical protein [Gulosibacter molinativorax]|uniref:Antitoxin VbhA domain-containing protein n=1 Tax=Gulosibacter molinativorax TaxID=256821 RepID=A0ABT7C6G0_9MICO|nr:hypothetical protein [Gulosibacter molinativorax]MDJ1370261.1 hypothetical protein [Gulosibacter molinativorax]QUY61677.1 Hypotetical protein [Gulosibacter molinativorax]